MNKFKDELTWEEKAKQNPMFAVMSDEIFLEATAQFSEEQLEVFYKQGERFWKRWFDNILWNYENIDQLNIMEYGCGMGRIINQAAISGLKCTGVDISNSQLEYAKSYCPNSNKIEFLLLDNRALIPAAPKTFDIVYSYAVLQHIKQSSALELAIIEICRVLKVGGLLKVQVRSQHQYLSQNIYSFFRSINFENGSLCFYLRKTGPLNIPIIRFNKHTNWSGACSNFSVEKLIYLFQRQGIMVNQIEFDQESHLLWIIGVKSN